MAAILLSNTHHKSAEVEMEGIIKPIKMGMIKSPDKERESRVGNLPCISFILHVDTSSMEQNAHLITLPSAHPIPAPNLEPFQEISLGNYCESADGFHDRFPL